MVSKFYSIPEDSFRCFVFFPNVEHMSILYKAIVIIDRLTFIKLID